MHHLVDCMICAVSGSGEILLARPRRGGQGGWSFPAERLAPGESPQRRAGLLARRLLGDGADLQLAFADTVPAAGLVEARVVLVYLAKVDRARPSPVAGEEDLLWWRLSEMGPLRISPLVRHTLIDRWASLTSPQAAG